MNMDVEQVIYSLNIEDVLMVIEENDMDIELDESDISFIECRSQSQVICN